jgi:excisionase family DNA binding protein
MIKPENYMSISQAADALGIVRQRVHRLVQNGRLQGVKIGERWLISKSSVENFERQPVGRPPKKKASETRRSKK